MSKRLTRYAETYNIMRQKAHKVHLPTASGKDGAVGCRNWSARPQPATTKLGLRDRKRGKINSLSAAAVVIEGTTHMTGFLS